MEARVAGPLGPPRAHSGQGLVRAPSVVLAMATRPAPYARPKAAATAAVTAPCRDREYPPTREALVEVAPARRAEVAEVAAGPGRPVTGVAEVHAAVMRRVDGGVWRLPSFATNGDRRLFKQQVAVYELIRALPSSSLELGVLGEAARAELPDAGQRRRLVARVIASKAGPEGANAAGASAAWRLLVEARERAGSAQVLPAGPAFAAATIEHERMRAARAAKGSRGGATCAERARKGMLFLQQVCGLRVAAEGQLAAAAAQPDSLGAAQPRRHAASLPLCIQMQLEHVAAGPEPSVARTVARAFLVAAFAHNTRLNDALNAKLWADESDLHVIRGRTTVRSKDGLPLNLFAPAEGYLGAWAWWPAHARDMADRPHAMPDFDATAASGPLAAHRLLEGVMPPAKALPALRAICAMEPLRMSAAEFKALGLTGHSIHGTGADMARFLGEACGFAEGDARALGHWLRDRNAPAEAPAARGGGARPVGGANAREDMERRYTQGAGRRGEEAEQLRVRCRLVQAVRAGLTRFGRPWWELPRDLSSWDALVPGAAAQLGPDAGDES